MDKIKWIEYMHSVTNIPKDKLEDEYNSRYKENTITLYNSVHGNYFDVQPNAFLEDLKKTKILAENGAIFDKHEINLAPTVTTIVTLLNLRKQYKGLMFKAIAEKDLMSAAIHDLNQVNTKRGTNAGYGLQTMARSKYYNFDVASSITARGRACIAINGLTLEMALGSYRPYRIEAHIKFIECASAKHVPEDLLDLVEVPTDEAIIKHILRDHYNGYYAMDVIIDKVSKLNDTEKKKVYYASNLDACIRIPKFKEVLTRILKQQNKDILEVQGTDKSKWKDTLYIAYDHSPEHIKEDVEYIKRIFKYLLVGFYWYGGDFDKYGNVYLTPQDVFRTIEREAIILTDTDSVIFALEPSVNKIKSIYDNIDDIIPNIDDDWKNYILGTYIIAAADYMITDGLAIYTDKSYIPEDYRKRIAYKQEFVFRTLQTTKGAKNYLGIISIREGLFLEYEEVDLKGLSLKKTNFNKLLSDKAKYIAINLIANVKEPNINLIFSEIEKSRLELDNYFRKRENIDVFTVAKLKTGYENTPKGEYRLKAVNLYNRLFDSKIPLPGSFQTCKIDLDDAEEYLEEQYPEIYKKLLEEQEYRTIMSTTLSIYRRTEKLWPDGNLPDIIKEYIEEIKSIDNSEELRSYITYIKKSNKDNIVNNTLDPDVINWIKNISMNNVKLKDIDRIAIPIDEENVHPFISDHVDLKDLAIYDNLIAVVTQGLGFSIVRNNKDKQITHNIISYY